MIICFYSISIFFWQNGTEYLPDKWKDLTHDQVNSNLYQYQLVVELWLILYYKIYNFAFFHQFYLSTYSYSPLKDYDNNESFSCYANFIITWLSGHLLLILRFSWKNLMWYFDPVLEYFDPVFLFLFVMKGKVGYKTLLADSFFVGFNGHFALPSNALLVLRVIDTVTNYNN